MVTVHIGRYISFDPNRGVELHRAILDLDRAEANRLLAIADAHVQDEMFLDCNCGARGYLYDRNDVGGNISLEQYLAVLEDYKAFKAAKEAKKRLTKRRRAEFNAHRQALMLKLIDTGAIFRCVACGSGDDLTVDHITPISRGGTDDILNLRFLCHPCNSRKGDRVGVHGLG